jgi:hypothetical protein
MLCIDAESHKSSGLVELRKESRAFRIVAVLSRVTLKYATSGVRQRVYQLHQQAWFKGVYQC